MPDLNAAIRARINSPMERPFTDAESALIAVLDKCQQIRDVAGVVAFAGVPDEFEQTIARALGIPTT